MKYSIYTLIKITIIICIFNTCTDDNNPVAPDEKPFGSEIMIKLENAFDEAMGKYEIPGAIVGIWSPEGNYLRAKGFSNLATNEPMRVDNHFRIGSVTKTFTGTIVLKLVEENKIHLDSSLAYYLPQYKFPKADKITVRMLGNMTSGIYSYSGDQNWVQSNLENNWEKVWTADELVQVALQHPLDFEPGTKYNYSNTTPILLGLICEKVTGKTMKELMEEKIFKKYNLHDTSWPENRYLPAPYSHGYSKMNSTNEFKDMTLTNPSWGGASGNLISNIYDLNKWIKMLGTGSLYSTAMHSERIKWATGSNNMYGFAIFNALGDLNTLMLGHTGAIWGYNTFAFYIPSKELVIIVNVNYYMRGESTPAEALAIDMLSVFD